jgi:hypothetical protein
MTLHWPASHAGPMSCVIDGCATSVQPFTLVGKNPNKTLQRDRRQVHELRFPCSTPTIVMLGSRAFGGSQFNVRFLLTKPRSPQHTLPKLILAAHRDTGNGAGADPDDFKHPLDIEDVRIGCL